MDSNDNKVGAEGSEEQAVPMEETIDATSFDKLDSTTVIKRNGSGLPDTSVGVSEAGGVRNADGSTAEYQGQEFGDYIIESCLGVGGMGEVWLAHPKGEEQKVAIKILRTDYLDANPDFFDRFMNEISHTTKMDHPNIIKAYGGGQHKNTAYLVTEFIDGESVDDHRESLGGAMPEKEALTITRSIAEGLRYVWNNFNLIHRDIKPANIMITKSGTPKLMDMGLSKTLEHTEKALTVTGEVLGSPSYMSPEQAAAKKQIDFKADIYGLGTTLYRLVTGLIPYTLTDKNESIFALLKRVITEPLPPAYEKNPAISEACSELILKMTEKNPDDRQDSWEEVIRDIDLVLEGKSVRGGKAGTAVAGEGSKSNNLMLFLIIGFTIAVLAVIVVVYIIFSG